MSGWAIGMVLSVLLAGQVPKSGKPPVAKSGKQRAFEFLDKDGNGLLTRDEFVGGSVGKAAEAKLKQFKELDADKSGALDFEEFKKYQLPRRTPQELARAFARIDRNGDGRLTMEEMLSGPSAGNRTAARRTFLRLDTNEDGVLTLEEFQHRDPNAKVSYSQQFRIRDTNDDGYLDREEFLRPSVGKPFHDAAKAAFVRADVDKDGRISRDEYLLTRVEAPSAETLFRVLDRDGKGRLSVEQMTRTMMPQHAAAIRRDFARFDADHDGLWSPEEYEAWRRAGEGPEGPSDRSPGRRWWIALVCGCAFLLLAGGAVVYAVMRSRSRRRWLPLKAAAAPLPSHAGEPHNASGSRPTQAPTGTATAADRPRPPVPRPASQPRTQRSDGSASMTKAGPQRAESKELPDEAPSIDDFQVH